MSTSPMFDTRLLGQTEKAANAILDRLLAETGVTEPQWVALSLLAAGEEQLDSGDLIDQVAGALKRVQADARAHITGLADARLIDVPQSSGSPVTFTDEGRRLYGRIRAEAAEVTRRLWGDLPPQDLAIAGRVLSIVLERAESELRAIG